MDQYRAGLDEGKPQARAALGLIGNKYTVDWSEYLGADWSEPVKTAVDMARLRALGKAITTYPADWTLQPRVLAIMQARERMVAGELALDWGCAENLAYASLIQEGYPVRLTGQDSGRGTFFHRHAVLHDQTTGRSYVPLQHLATNQPTFTVTDSVLSEEAVMGFEYGFSTTEPHCLTIWEGQFGDFANGAQVIIDQFISSGEAKWGRLVRTHAVPAARLRRPGSGAFLGPARALPAALRRVQHPGVRAFDARADVPHAAPADAAAAAQAAHHHDAEEPAAPSALGVAPRGARRRRLPDHHR